MSDYIPVEGHKWLATRNGIYYIRKDGKNTSLHTRDEAEALEQYIRKLGKPIAPKRTVYIPEAWDLFSEEQKKRQATTLKRYTSSWKTWCAPLLNHLRVSEVEPAHIHQVMERASDPNTKSEKTGRKLSESSLNSIQAAMSALFQFCMVEPHRYRLDNPCDFIEWTYDFEEPAAEEVDPKQILTWEEIDKIANAFGDWVKPAVFQRRTFTLLMPRCGFRISEGLALRTDSLMEGPKYGPYGALFLKDQVNPDLDRQDFTSRETWFKALKGELNKAKSKKRFVHLGPETRQLWDTYRERGEREGWIQPGGLMFPNERGFPHLASAFGTEISEASKKAIGRRIVSHWFRHTYASDQFLAGADVAEVARLLGNGEDVCRQTYIWFIDHSDWGAKVAARSR